MHLLSKQTASAELPMSFRELYRWFNQTNEDGIDVKQLLKYQTQYVDVSLVDHV